MKNQNDGKTHCKHGHEFTKENTYTNTKDGHRSCKICKRLVAHNRDPKKRTAVALRTRLKTSYGLTPEEYSAKLQKQNNICALCGKPFEGNPRAGLGPALDHNHTTGALRSFIHNTCNKALGLLKDDPNICRMAAAYLERHANNGITHYSGDGCKTHP